MSIIFARIDDRLIHGQVASTWIKNFSIEQIIIINNKIAENKTQIQVIEITAPSNIIVKVFGVKEFTDIFHKTEIKRKTLLIFTNPMDVLSCINMGVSIPFLNVGGMKYEDGKEKLTKAIAISPEEKQAFINLMKKNIRVEVQMVPNDTLTYIQDYISIP
ncbi:MAG: PTS system mannose/fructose/N-acetylgalactosamine-transporter subunit IIB [Brevinema sp.]